MGGPCTFGPPTVRKWGVRTPGPPRIAATGRTQYDRLSQQQLSFTIIIITLVYVVASSTCYPEVSVCDSLHNHHHRHHHFTRYVNFLGRGHRNFFGEEAKQKFTGGSTAFHKRYLVLCVSRFSYFSLFVGYCLYYNAYVCPALWRNKEL